jgi:membrane protein required for colicin V production
MNFLDIIFCFFLIFFIVKGFIRGFIKELAVIVGALAGFYFAYSYYPLFASEIVKLIPNFKYTGIASFSLIFVATFMIALLLGAFINYVLKLAVLKWLDRSLGAIIGALKGIFLISILLIALTAFLPRGNSFIKNSFTAPYVLVISNKIVKFIPKEVKDIFDKKIKSLIAHY